EVALPEALVALALDDLEEDRADHGLGEDLQQEAAAGAAVDQQTIPPQPFERLAVTGQAAIDHLVVGIRHVHERDVAGPQGFDRGVDVFGSERNVLDAFAAIGAEILLDLRFVVGRFVDGDADLAAGAGHRPALQAGQLAFDVEVPDLAEVEEPFVEVRPQVHAAAMDVVREVIDIGQADAPWIGVDSRRSHEVDVIDAAVAVAVDEKDEAVADALDRRDIQFHRPDLALHRPGTERL